MEKLISADRLLDHIEKMYKAGAVQSIDDVRYAIIDAPEEEAIPIDWLKKKFSAKGVYATEEYFRTQYAAKKIIREWFEDHGH